MKKFTAILMVSVLALTIVITDANAQDETFNFAEGHSKVWNLGITQIKDLADAMPEDQYNYRPHDSVRTFAEQLIHIGGSSTVIANLYLKDIPPPQDRPEMNVAEMSKEEILGFVIGQLETTGELIAGCSDQMLMETITSFGGNEMTRLEGLLTVHDHFTNHKAKANLYVRITGNKPPSYKYY